MPRRILGLLLVTALFLLPACDTFSSQEEEGPADADSLAMEAESSTRSMVARGTPPPPELLGSWKLVNMQLQDSDLPMTAEDIGESMLSFDAEGNMTIATPDLPSQTVSYSYRNGVLYSQQQGEQNVTRLNADSLVIEEVIDAQTVTYTYIRVD